MRISETYFKGVDTYDKSKTGSGMDKVHEVQSTKDLVSISGDAKDYQMVQSALRDIPDIRKDKVRELEEKYATGSYNISGKEIADKIVDRYLDKRV